jgi:broad specificity phosphatase PhoE
MGKIMVKIIFLILFCTTVNLFANPTANKQYKIWVIRHGQRAKVSAPTFDPPLTKLGIIQAEKAAHFLKKNNFNGKIYASPYRRTLQTASIIAKKLNKKVYIAPFIQEFVRFPGVHSIKYRPLNLLQKEFPLIAQDAQLPANWVIKTKETLDSVKKRYSSGIEKLNLKNNDEILLVTHGAVLKAAHLYAMNLGSNYKWSKTNWNCCISSYQFSNKSNCQVKLFFDVSFLLDKEITNNERYMIKQKK